MNNDLERLRKLILGAEYDELLALRTRINDESELSATLSAVITEALSQRESADNSVSEVLAPSIDRAIASSINQDPKKLAESLYPIMGPAIRKSISETLQQMLENFNDLLEQSLSPQSLKWRFDAWRTGRSYSELVLLNTLEYRVEQVFLIHAETSLLAQHVVHDLAHSRDADMVSSMFSAIQDFIQDSFDVEEGDVLDTLRLGDLTVLIVRGPLAFLAVVVRGRPPETLRLEATEALEKIHRLRRRELIDYEGDPDVFSSIAPLLGSLVKDRRREASGVSRSVPWLAIIVIVVLLAAAGYYAQEQAQARAAVIEARESFLAGVDARPGVVLLSSQLDAGELSIKALRDPLADPLELMPPEGAAIERLVIIEQPYVAIDDEILTRRVNRLFAPADGVKLVVENGVLRLTGVAEVGWFDGVDEQYALIEGISGLDASGLQLVDVVAERLRELVSLVESFSYDFERAVTEIQPGRAVRDLAMQLAEIIELSSARGEAVFFDVVGATDETGTDAANREIGRQRAASLVRLLESEGIPADRMMVHAGIDDPRAGAASGREVLVFVETRP